MTKQAELLKAALRVELDKKGSSLADLESDLKKEAMEKRAAGPGGFLLNVDPSHVMSIFGSIANLYGLSAAGVGAAGAYAGFQGYKGLANSDEKIDKKQQEAQQYKDALRSLTSAQQNNHSL